MLTGPLGFHTWGGRSTSAVTPDRRQANTASTAPRLAFRMAGRIAMNDALAAASPHARAVPQRLTVVCPSSAKPAGFTSAVASRAASRIGIGAARPAGLGWDRVDALIRNRSRRPRGENCARQSHGLATYEAQSTISPPPELNGTLARPDRPEKGCPTRLRPRRRRRAAPAAAGRPARRRADPRRRDDLRRDEVADDVERRSAHRGSGRRAEAQSDRLGHGCRPSPGSALNHPATAIRPARPRADAARGCRTSITP